MGIEEDAVKKQQIIEASGRNISHNVRWTECGCQSVEDSPADIAILLRKDFPISAGEIQFRPNFAVGVCTGKQVNGEAEIQPVEEPVQSNPAKPEEDTETKPDKKKAKREKKSKRDATSSIGNPWTTSLFNCHEDHVNAVMTAFLPCITFGQIAEVLDEGELASPWRSFVYLLVMPVLCSQWIMGLKYRKKLRKKYDLVEAPYTDSISHIFCPCCSLCQEYRELKNRGLDPSLGWRGILAQQKGKQTQEQEAQAAPQNQEMVK